MVVQTKNGSFLEVTNPASGEVVGVVEEATPSDVDRIINLAEARQRVWRNTARHARAQVITTYVNSVRAEATSLASLLTREQGKPIGQSLDEIELHCRLFEGYARRALSAEGKALFLDSEPGREADIQMVRHNPLGVIAGIVPFNFPVELFAHKVAPSILTGNTIVLKPSEETPLVADRLLELLRAAGLPDNVVSIVHGRARVGQQLVSDPRIAAVSFTGSTDVGAAIAVQGAATLKTVILELGGNDAMIVLEDADLDEVAQQATFGRTLANGQSCCSNKRLVVHKNIYNEVVERMTAKFENLTVGDPQLKATDLGPVINSSAAAKIQDEVSLSTSQGARLCTGGGVSGAYVGPTVLAEVTPEMDVARDLEIFGPVVAIISAESEAQAIAISNASRYGLSSSVFTRDLKRGFAVASQLHAGQVVLNATGMYRSDAMPFGGVKASGSGREGLSVSLDEYTSTKTITLPNLVPFSASLGEAT